MLTCKAPAETEDVMTYRRTPPLSPEGTREVLEEMAKPPEDTPERREMEKRVRIMEEVRRRSGTLHPAGFRGRK